MRYIIIILFIFIFLASCKNKINQQAVKAQSTKQVLEHALDNAAIKYRKMLDTARPEEGLPSSTNKSGKYISCSPDNWVSGFFPGSPWYLYEYTGDGFWLRNAKKWTSFLEYQQYNKKIHDLGFMMFCSYGNGYRLTKDETYKNILIQSSKSLVSRYNENTGCIHSWDFKGWWKQYPVIIDNMINLEMLTWASKTSKDTIYEYVATRHANTTIDNHFRDDSICYHVVDYDTISGKAIGKGTFQGFSDSSSWARGQAWGLYGYSMMYRETGKEEYLVQAENIAGFILKNLPGDKISYWDFNDPEIPNTNRDISATTIMASALLELSRTNAENVQLYLETAEKILLILASSKYTAEEGTNANFILKHSVVSKPHNLGVNVALNYSDYYYMESIIRYLELKL